MCLTSLAGISRGQTCCPLGCLYSSDQLLVGCYHGNIPGHVSLHTPLPPLLDCHSHVGHLRVSLGWAASCTERGVWRGKKCMYVYCMWEDWCTVYTHFFFSLPPRFLPFSILPPSFLPPPLPPPPRFLLFSYLPPFLLPSSYLLPTFPPSPPSHPLSLPSPQVSSKSFAVHPPSLEQRKLFFFPVLLTRPTQPPPPKPRPCSGKITEKPPFWASGSMVTSWRSKNARCLLIWCFFQISLHFSNLKLKLEICKHWEIILFV